MKLLTFFSFVTLLASCLPASFTPATPFCIPVVAALPIASTPLFTVLSKLLPAPIAALPILDPIVLGLFNGSSPCAAGASFKYCSNRYEYASV